MRIVILAVALASLSIWVTGATLVVPKVQYIEFYDPVIIASGENSKLCKKYDSLFMEALHETLECSEDYGPPPYLYEKCEKLRRRLAEYSRLRSRYCYGEEI